MAQIYLLTTVSLPPLSLRSSAISVAWSILSWHFRGFLKPDIEQFLSSTDSTFMITSARNSNVSRPRALAEKDPNMVAARSSPPPPERTAKQVVAASSKPAGPHEGITGPEECRSDAYAPTRRTRKRPPAPGGGRDRRRQEAQDDHQGQRLLPPRNDIGQRTPPPPWPCSTRAASPCPARTSAARFPCTRRATACCAGSATSFKRDGVTQAGFCRGGGVPDGAAPPMQPSRLMEKKGAMKGNVVF